MGKTRSRMLRILVVAVLAIFLSPVLGPSTADARRRRKRCYLRKVCKWKGKKKRRCYRVRVKKCRYKRGRRRCKYKWKKKCYKVRKRKCKYKRVCYRR